MVGPRGLLQSCMFYGAIYILRYVLQGKKPTESPWHEVHMQRYIYVNKGISVMEPQIHDEAQKNKERKDHQSDPFEISTFEMNY